MIGKKSLSTAEEQISLEARIRKPALTMLMPAVIVLLLLGLFPFFYLLYTLTQQWVITTGQAPAFIGLKNFLKLIQDARFWVSFRKSMVFSSSVVSMEFGIGLLVALILVNHRMKVFRSLVLLPMMMAPTAVGLIWRFMYHDEIGIINIALELFGIDGPLWLGDQRFAMFALIAVDVWTWTPFMILILFSGLSSIPREIYEATMVDGATGGQRFFNITLPLLVKPIFVAIAFRVMDSFRVFDTVYVLTAGGPNNSTELLNFYTYKVAFRFFDIGYGSTLAFITLIILLVLSRFLIKILKD